MKTADAAEITSLGGNPRPLAAAKKISGDGFKFLNKSADTIASKLDCGKPAAAKFASTLIRSALDATASLSPAALHCHPPLPSILGEMLPS
jgi:hypothetical protein